MRLQGLRIGLTGGLEALTRQEFKARLAAVGAHYVVRPEDGLDVLVAGSSPLPSKVAAAEAAGATVLDWPTFAAHLDAPVPLDVPLAEGLVDGPAALERDDEAVRILDLVVPRQVPGPLTPALAAFAHHVVDAPTLQLLRGIARAILLAQPCVIEGPTSTAKTSSIRFLAALVGAEVVRLNLNGQTDTGELVGRYVPDGSGWRFAEGLVPRAMRAGWWIVLDEVNLAEPAVLERLNPVLERTPGLVLTEGPGTRFGPGGDVVVHPGFRVLATMNPAEYAGRAVLSEAWRDRFTAHLVAEPPDELALQQLVAHARSGEHPAVVLDGIRWGPAALEGAPCPVLSDPAFDDLLPQLAPLFAGLAAMSDPASGTPLGVERRERPVFSRRGLLALLDAVRRLSRHDPVRGGRVDAISDPVGTLREAVHAATIARLATPADRDRVTLLVRSLGL
jgi:hypothetical protein